MRRHYICQTERALGPGGELPPTNWPARRARVKLESSPRRALSTPLRSHFQRTCCGSALEILLSNAAAASRAGSLLAALLSSPVLPVSRVCAFASGPPQPTWTRSRSRRLPRHAKAGAPSTFCPRQQRNTRAEALSEIGSTCWNGDFGHEQPCRSTHRRPKPPLGWRCIRCVRRCHE